MNARPMLTDRALETMLARRAGRARLGDLPEVIVMAVSTEPVPHRPMLRWPRWVGRPHRLAHPAIVAALLVLGAVAAAAAVGAWLLLREAPPKYPLQPTGLQAMATTWQPVAIVPDAGGGYWVERVGGLVRFGADGRPAGEWSAADDRALAFGDSHTAAMGIAADSHGGVWTWQGPTIRQFDGRGFTELVDAGAQVSGLAEAVDGSLWIATIEGQVLAWDGTSLATRWSRAADGGAIGYPSTATVFAIAAAPTGDVWGIFGSRDGPTATGWYDGHAWRYFGRESGLDLLQEPELAFAPDGTPWLLNGSPYDAEARELLAFDGARWTRRVMSPAGASSLAIGAGGVPWVIEGGWTSGGVWRLDGERWRGLDPRADLPEAEDALALAASGGDILVVTDRGTGRIRDGRMTAVWSASGSGVAGRVLAGGDPGPVWVSDGRVARPYADGAWGDELPLPGDGGLTVDRAGRLWAWGGAGLAVRDGGAWRTVAMGSPDRVAIGPDGSAWVLRTTYDELGNPVRPPTLRRFVPSGSSWQVAEAITLEAAPSLYTIDPDGRLLFLSESAASRLSMRLRVDGAWVNLPAVDDGGTPVPMDAVVDAAFAPSGDLWVLGGTWTSVGWNWGPPDNMRLGVLHDGAWTVFSCGEGGARAAVGACGTAIDPVSEPGHLAFGEDGSVWLAGDGLARFDGAEWTWVAKGVSLSNPVVAGDGSVWAAGAGTAFRWVPGS